MAAKQTAAEETLNQVALMCLDALNEAKTMKEYEAWVSRIFAIANPDDDDPNTDE